jgi:thiol:disulfide interchange protein DsbD
MEAMKKALAFPMYAAAAWLLWVFTLQTSPTAMAALLGAAVILALAAWLYGAGQRRQAEGSRASVPIYAATALAGVAAVALAFGGASAPMAAAQGQAQTSASALPSQAFSPQALADLQAQGRPVLVDFTAAWCVTCQVNERVALSGSRVAAAFRRVGGVYMKADWTRSDPQISRALAEHGRAGVPLYLVYPRGGGQPEVMGQVLTEGAVIAAMDRAARS